MKQTKAVCRKKWREWCLLFILVITTFMCFGKSVRYAEVLKERLHKLDFVASGSQQGMDYTGARSAQTENLKRDDPLEFVNWTQMGGVQVSASGLETVEECDILLLCGRSDLLFPGYAVLDMKDLDSCLISSALSGRLFGGENTSGLIVEVQDRKLEVLDVIDSKEAFLVYEAGENDPYSFDRATVECVSGGFIEAAENYQQLCGEWNRMENRIFVWAAQAACIVVPGILWIYLVFVIKKYTKEKNADRTEKMIWKLFLYLLSAGGIIFLFQGIHIPEDMIPAKWSDPGFWMEYGKKMSASCQVLIRSEKKIPDISMLKEFVKMLQWVTAAAVGETAFLCGFRKLFPKGIPD